MSIIIIKLCTSLDWPESATNVAMKSKGTNLVSVQLHFLTINNIIGIDYYITFFLGDLILPLEILD